MLKCTYHPFPLSQTFKLFEKLAEQDRERQLSEMQKRAESRCVPAAVQELEVNTEPQEGKEEPSPETAPKESASDDGGNVPAPAASDVIVNPQPDSSNSSSDGVSGTPEQGDQAAAATSSEGWVSFTPIINIIITTIVIVIIIK